MNDELVIKSKRMTIDVRDCIELQRVIAKLDALSDALSDYDKRDISNCLENCSNVLQDFYYKYIEDECYKELLR